MMKTLKELSNEQAQHLDRAKPTEQELLKTALKFTKELNEEEHSGFLMYQPKLIMDNYAL